MKLKIENLIPYLEHDIHCNIMGEVNSQGENKIFNLKGLENNGKHWEVKVECNIIETHHIEDTFPILRPIEDIKKECFINDDFIIPYDTLELEKYLGMDNFTDIKYWIDYLPHNIVNQLHQWHFDTQNLIKNNLAIKLV